MTSGRALLVLAAGLAPSAPAWADSTPPMPFPPEETAAAPPPPPRPKEAVPVQRIRVDVDSSREGSVLERLAVSKETTGALLVLPFEETSSTWEPICVTPCRDLELDRNGVYRVATANGSTGSGRFTLPRAAETTRVHVDAGDLASHRLGILITSLGAIAAGIGVGLVSAAPAFPREDRARPAGFITAGGGIALLGVGIPLVLFTRSHVTDDAGRSLALGSLGERL